MADRYRAYAPPSSHDRDPRGNYSGYLPPEGSLASLYTSRPPVLPGGSDVRRSDMPLLSRAYGSDGPTGVINPALPGVSGLPAGARAQGHSPLQDSTLAGRAYGLDGPTVVINPSLPGVSGLPAGARAQGHSPLQDATLAGLGGLAPTRAPGSNPLEEPALVGRSSSLGKSAGIPDVERHSPVPIPNLDGPSEDESNILFVDGLPTDCTRREVAHLFRPFVGFKDIRVVHKEPRRSGDKAYVLCFVEFENAKCAFTAMVALQEYRFDDRKPDAPLLKIQFARFPFRLPAAQVDRKHLMAH